MLADEGVVLERDRGGGDDNGGEDGIPLVIISDSLVQGLWVHL